MGDLRILGLQKLPHLVAHRLYPCRLGIRLGHHLVGSHRDYPLWAGHWGSRHGPRQCHHGADRDRGHGLCCCCS